MSVCSNPSQVCSNPSQVCSNPMSVYPKPSQVYSKPSQVYSNPMSVYSNPMSVYSNPMSVYPKPRSYCSDMTSSSSDMTSLSSDMTSFPPFGARLAPLNRGGSPGQSSLRRKPFPLKRWLPTARAYAPRLFRGRGGFLSRYGGFVPRYDVSEFHERKMVTLHLGCWSKATYSPVYLAVIRYAQTARVQKRCLTS